MWFLHYIIRTIERFFLHHRINKRPSIVKSLLQWTTFCQNSSLWPVQLEWVIASLSYASPFATRRLWSTEEGPLEREMATHSNILAVRTPWTVWKGKTTWQQKMSPQGQKVAGVLLGKRKRQSLNDARGMKRLGWRRQNVQPWMCLVVKVNSDAAKNDIA